MFDLVKNLIDYGGTNSFDSNIGYCCMVLILLGVVVTIDLVYKLFLRFLPKDSK